MTSRTSPGRGAVTAASPKLIPLSRAKLPDDAPTLASYLIGKSLVRQLHGETFMGRIVETEAYSADDPASHSFGGETRRNRSMYLQRGHAYVYRIYGMWWCLNVSAGRARVGAAVLLRALEPLVGLTAMSANAPGVGCEDATRGPGRLCRALAITGEHDGLDLCVANGQLWLAGRIAPRPSVVQSVRIGLSRAIDAPLRFYEKGNSFVSGPKRLRS
jgi:DNA-3-methyladenine glycosylase